MGASRFMQSAEGKDAKEAFKNGVEDAQNEHGRGGYSGSLAEKSSYTMIDLPEGLDPHKYAQELIRNDDRRISDKWGPAGCILMNDGRYLFFGYASS